MAGAFVARALTAPPRPRRFDLLVEPAGPGTVSVPRRKVAHTDGTWGLMLRDGGHLRVEGPAELAGAKSVWRVARGAQLVRPGLRGSWTGIVDPHPSDARIAHRDVTVDAPAGSCPAWLLGAQTGPVWAVHIHGMGSTRAGTLRGAAVADRAGLPGMAVTYRNTAEGPRSGTGRSGLGAGETADVAAHLRHLLTLGATRFVMFGWSMGAQMALRIAADPAWAPRVAGVVLDSPVLDWRSVIRANLHRKGLPSILASSAEAWLSDPRRARLAGIGDPVDLDAADWTTRAAELACPVLVLHGTDDWSAPAAASETFAEAAPAGLVQLELLPGGHTTTWNVNPRVWEDRVQRFLNRVTS